MGLMVTMVACASPSKLPTKITGRVFPTTQHNNLSLHQHLSNHHISLNLQLVPAPRLALDEHAIHTVPHTILFCLRTTGIES